MKTLGIFGSVCMVSCLRDLELQSLKGGKVGDWAKAKDLAEQADKMLTASVDKLADLRMNNTMDSETKIESIDNVPTKALVQVSSGINLEISTTGSVYTGEWQVSDWSACSLVCGGGTQTRTVECRAVLVSSSSSSTSSVSDAVAVSGSVVTVGSLLLDSACSNTGVDRPSSTQDCSGPCYQCADTHTEFFTRAGFGSPTDTAIYLTLPDGVSLGTTDSTDSTTDSTTDFTSIATSVTGVESSAYQLCSPPTDPDNPLGATCCTADNEDTIRSQATRVSSTLDKLLQTTPDMRMKTKNTLQRYMQLISLRLAETSDTLIRLNEVIDRAGGIASMVGSSGFSDSMNVVPVLQEALQTRKDDLKAAAQGAREAFDLVDSQIAVYNEQLTNAATDSSFSKCSVAAVTLYANIACSSCDPRFTTAFIDGSTISVSTSDCQSLYNSCKGTVSRSHSLLKQALAKLKTIHVQLKSSASKIQPALTRIWKKLKFEWVPGNTKLASILPTDLNSLPDLTRLKCIKSSELFSLPTISTQSDFCAMYTSPFEPSTISARIKMSLQQGIAALSDLTACDGCLHGVLMRLPALVAEGRAALDVTLPSEDALGYTPCLMADATQKSALLVNMFQKSVMGSKRSDSADSKGEKSRSIRGLSASARNLALSELYQSKLKSKLISGVFVSLKVDLTGSSSAPPKIEFSDSGVDAAIAGNFSSYESLTNLKALLPPRPSWETRLSGASPTMMNSLPPDLNSVGTGSGVTSADLLSVWDKTCTEHTDCETDTDSPWWFCASTSACDAALPSTSTAQASADGPPGIRSVGRCSLADRLLLTSGSRCVRGQCRDGAEAIDGVCPDMAVCPSTSAEPFGGPSYFRKFRLVVDEEGSEGVCDCAFTSGTSTTTSTSSTTSSSPVGRLTPSSVAVSNPCQQAKCAMYASLFEESSGCKMSLVDLCTSQKTVCPELDCSDTSSLWDPPVCEAEGFTMKSDLMISNAQGIFVSIFALLGFIALL